MGDAEQDLDALDAEIVDDGEGLGLGEGGHEPLDSKQISLFERWLDGQLDGTYDAVIGKTALQRLRYATRKLAKIEDAAQAGYERAKRELRAEQLGPEDRDRLKAEFLQELRAEDGQRRNALRLGVPPELESLFSGLPPDDFKAWQKRADELHAGGIHWGDADPLVRQVAASRLQAAQQAATEAQQNGQPVSLAPGNGVPPEVQEQLVRGATEAMQAGQAGGRTVEVEDLADDIRKAAANPGAYSEEQRLALADRFNRDLDALSRGFAPGLGG